MPKPPSPPAVNTDHALIALGANLPQGVEGPRATVLAALAALANADGMTLSRASRLYESPAFPKGSGPAYVNCAALLCTRLAPEALLARLHAIEEMLGRRREGTGRWAARAIDIDLLAMGEAVRPDAAAQDRWRRLTPAAQQRVAPDRLILPHPRLQDRAFVLAPLAEIAPGWRHPRTGLTVMQMLAALPPEASEGLRPLAPPG